MNNSPIKNDQNSYGIEFVSEMIIQNRLNTLLDFYKKRYNIFRKPFGKEFFLTQEKSDKENVLDNKEKYNIFKSRLVKNKHTFVESTKYLKNYNKQNPGRDIIENNSSKDINIQKMEDENKERERCNIF